MVTINPYSTQKEALTFYFPSEGKFHHYPSNIAENGIVVARSPTNEFEVGKKRVIKKVETWYDLMMTATTAQEKKKKVIELLDNDFYKIYD